MRIEVGVGATVSAQQLGGEIKQVKIEPTSEAEIRARELLIAIGNKGVCYGDPTFNSKVSNLPEAYKGEPPEEKRERKDLENEVKDEYCNHCPVKGPCGEYGVLTSPEFGLWGGMTEHEVKAERQRRRRHGEVVLTLPKVRVRGTGKKAS